MQVDRHVLWERIQERLAREPERVKYNEGSFEWMEKTQDFYEHFDWDMTVENNHNSLGEVTASLLETLEERVPDFDSPRTRKAKSCRQEGAASRDQAAAQTSSKLVQPIPL